MGSFRNKILAVLDVALRVPPIFIVDSLFMNGFGGPISGSKLLQNHLYGQLIKSPPVLSTSIDQHFDDSSSEIPHDQVEIISSMSSNATNSILDQIFSSSDEEEVDIVFEGGTIVNELPSHMIWITCYIYCLLMALIIFTLSTKHLFSFYLWILSLSLIFWSYFANETYINYVNSIQNSSLPYELLSFKSTSLTKFTGNYFLQVILLLSFCFLSSPRQSILSKKLVGALFLIPTIISLLPGTHPSQPMTSYEENLESNYMRMRRILLTISPVMSIAIALFYVMINVLTETRHILVRMYRDLEWARTIVRHYGIYTLVENQWSRLHVPQVLRVFWLTRLVEQALVMIAESSKSEAPILNSPNLASGRDGDFLLFTTILSSIPSQIPSIGSDAILLGCKELLIRGCETVIAVLGMTSVISSISHEIGSAIQWFLSSEAPEDRGIGTVSAILFFILALQTGITGMEPEKRFTRLYRNICLLFTAILHFIHNIVSPQLFSLSASRNMSISKHARALAVCLILIVLPAYFMIVLWKSNPISTWLLAVSAFSIEVIIKVVISLLIYVLFMMDAYRTTMWEPLDDYVYYIKSFGSSVEFIFGIFLFFNGAWILLFESGGTIRALMMCIHAYFNIWMQAKQGWQKFMRRRLAVHKINSLPEASKQQLDEFDDVCAICYQELQSARITRCKHYFHGVCLRKWLYVQDICPLCHETLTAESEQNQEAAENVRGTNQSNDEVVNGDQPNDIQQDNLTDHGQGSSRRFSTSCPRRDHEEQVPSRVLESMGASSSANSFRSTSSSFPLVDQSRSLEEEIVDGKMISEEVCDEQLSSQMNQGRDAASFVTRRTSRRLMREQPIDVSDSETMSTHSNRSSATAQSSVSTVRFAHDHHN